MEYDLNVKMYLARFDQILSQMSKRMLSPRPKNSITRYFIECMIPHHQAAIYMCQNLLRYTNYEPLIQIANGIIRMQTRGIEQMRMIYRTTMGYSNTSNEIEKYTEQFLEITKNMIYRMQNSERTSNINLNFVSEMIPHHEGAIQMCNNLLQYQIDPRLVKVAQNIIKEQSEGVKELIQIRNNLINT